MFIHAHALIDCEPGFFGKTDTRSHADADHDGLPPQPLVFYRGTIGGFASEG